MLEALVQAKSDWVATAPTSCPSQSSSVFMYNSDKAPDLTCSACFSPLPELLVQALLRSSGWLQQAGVPFRCDAHVAVGPGLQPAYDVCRAGFSRLTTSAGVSAKLEDRMKTYGT